MQETYHSTDCQNFITLSEDGLYRCYTSGTKNALQCVGDTKDIIVFDENLVTEIFNSDPVIN